ncbi:MAG: LysM peptidoglycan-binding domain-containing protein, partial [Chitinivibrionales bacterium]|nr:LysM peptidoglycan-binding domain-containing protein [Chitinivibrionales bacterium]
MTVTDTPRTDKRPVLAVPQRMGLRLTAAATCLGAVIVASCTPPPQPVRHTPPADTLVVPASLDTAEAVYAVPPPPLCASLDALERRATAAAEDGDHALAHRLAGAMLHLLEQEDAATGLASYELEEYFSRVARIYADLLPPSYADSVDESIAMQVFQNQLFSAYDSLSAHADDSVVARMVACQRTTQYGLPLVFNDRVRVSLAFFAQARKAQMERWLGRAQVYLPAITALLADSGLPADLAYLPLIESGFNPRAYSYAHASGIWQFIPSTAKIFGLRRSYWVDERRDPLRSTMAAIAYMKKLYAEFEDWFLVLASYNCGENGTRRAIKRAGVADYWRLRLPKQTMEYVPRYIAALVVARNPSCFGLTADFEPVVAPDTVHVSDCIDLGRIAKGIGVPADTLEALNPHILRWCTPPDMDDVILYLPHGTAERFRTFAGSLTPADKVKWTRYRIQRGDNLISIARRFNTSVPAIRSVNKLRSNRIVAGKMLFIPIAAGSNWSPPPQQQAAPSDRKTPQGAIQYLVKHGETLSEIARLFDTNIDQICRWNGVRDADEIQAGSVIVLHLKGGSGSRSSSSAQTAAKTPQGTKKVYRVRRGDNLSSIAARLGVELGELLAWNGKSRSSALIQPGEELVYYVPKGAGGGVPVRRSEGDTIVYQVQPGDNLTRIAELFYV